MKEYSHYGEPVDIEYFSEIPEFLGRYENYKILPIIAEGTIVVKIERKYAVLDISKGNAYIIEKLPEDCDIDAFMRDIHGQMIGNDPHGMPSLFGKLFSKAQIEALKKIKNDDLSEEDRKYLDKMKVKIKSYRSDNPNQEEKDSDFDDFFIEEEEDIEEEAMSFLMDKIMADYLISIGICYDDMIKLASVAHDVQPGDSDILKNGYYWYKN